MKNNTEFYQDATIDGESISIDDFEMPGLSDGDGRDRTEPMENDVSVTVKMEYSLTATDSDPDGYRTPDGTESELSDAAPQLSDDCLDVAPLAGRCATKLSLTNGSPDHAVSDPDYRLPSQYDVDTLAGDGTAVIDLGYHWCLEVADNSFVNDARNYLGVASEDGRGVACWDNGRPALSERSESPRRSEPPSRSSTASPTAQQRQLGHEAVHKFEHDQNVGEPYSHLRLHSVSADMSMLFPEHAAAVAADAAPWSAQ